MAIELPRFEIPRINSHDLTSNVELPRLDTSRMELPKVDLPKVDLPKVDLPKVDMPRFDLPAIGRRLDGMGRDLRSLRIVREPSPTEARARAASTAGIWLLGGLGLGMALMYFFDPRVGRVRRQRLAARIGDLTAVAQHAITGPSRDTVEARDTDFELEERSMATDTSLATGASTTFAESGTGYGGGTGMDTGVGTTGETDSESDAARTSRMAELATTQGS